MGKEAKISLSILGVLLLIFSVLLFRKLTATDVAHNPGLETQVSEPSSGGLKREVDRKTEGPSAEDAPLPDRYAESVVPAVADEEIPSSSQAVSPNPLRRLSAQEPVELEEPVSNTISEDLDEPVFSTKARQEPEAGEPAAAPSRLGLEEDEDRAPLAADRETSDRSAAPTQWQSSSERAKPFSQESEPLPVENGQYTVQPNDSLWSISEKAYGTGGYFKALGEYNRANLPRLNRLTVGSALAVPPVSTLEQNFPGLCPKPRKSAMVKPRSQQVSAQPRRSSGGNVYVVEEGDTLFDIARYELGKASRWTEIYDLNREALGEDFDYLQPGTELALPAKNHETDSLTRQRDSRYQR